jgi:hypothetical protein
MNTYAGSQQLVRIVEAAINCAYRARSGIPASSEVLWMRGMSSHRVRHFLNHLCAHGPMGYLEVGTWTGSTLCSALYGNQEAEAVAIDNFSEFTEQFDPKRELLANLERFGPQLGPHRLIEGDCLTIPLGAIDRRFNVFFYDGNHELLPTARAIERFVPLMHSPFILVVDDWELNDEVSRGTWLALRSLRTHGAWHLPSWHGFHEGVAAFVVEAPASSLASLACQLRSRLSRHASARRLVVPTEVPS